MFLLHPIKLELGYAGVFSKNRHFVSHFGETSLQLHNQAGFNNSKKWIELQGHTFKWSWDRLGQNT